MVAITLFNLEGLFMGPVAQISSMLAFPVNDNVTCAKKQISADRDHGLSILSPSSVSEKGSIVEMFPFSKD